MQLKQENLQLGLSVIGVFFLLTKLLRFCKWSFHLLRTYGFKTYVDFKKYGKWTVITGGTSGIGRSLALELASRGLPIIIISRCENKLKEVSQEIERKYNVPTKTLAIDFKNNDRSTYEKIASFLKDLDIGILVNNVGMLPDLERFAHSKQDGVCHDILNVNVLPMYRMTQIILPGMKQRKRGLILNISSISAIIPVPYMALYGSTKALVNYFSQAIAMENKEFGIEIQSIMPAAVQTNMTKNLKIDSFTMKPDDYVESVLATVGKETKTHGCFKHEVQSILFGLANEKQLLEALKKESQKFNETKEKQKTN